MTKGEARVALGDGGLDHSFILPGAARAALFVEEPEDTAFGTYWIIVPERDVVVSAENWQECA
jgi:hypothetical protein